MPKLPLFRIHIDGKVSNISQSWICFEFYKPESRKNFEFHIGTHLLVFLSQLKLKLKFNIM